MSFTESLSSMPPLDHFQRDGSAFDVAKSGVVNWAMACPGFHDWLWQKLKESGRIRFDRQSRKWVGCPKSEVAVGPEVKRGRPAWDDVLASRVLDCLGSEGVKVPELTARILQVDRRVREADVAFVLAAMVREGTVVLDLT